MDQIRTQAERFGAELVTDDVISVDLTGEIKTVRTHGGEFAARCGDHRDRLGVQEARHSGRGAAGRSRCVLVRDL